ncbi:unnamed protein product [Candida verbasci]|uniref:Pre-rRNA-processing protein TSR2 n=1 Tax=Candida verbasci TaxID=1227364 RepID=A0A9W4TYR4_9ASCO|nr:unnamed protein product [Candida verbasci]
MTSIDPTDFIEVPEGTLTFQNEKQQAKFELGVCMAVYKWDELNIAVENQWGGTKSNEKRDWISGIVIELFNDSKVVDNQLIEETLLYAMYDEFETQIDNDSALEIAALILKIYRQVQVENYNLIDESYNKWLEKESKKKEIQKVHIEKDPNNPDISDSEDDEDEDDEKESEDVDMDVDKPEPQGPIIYDDGFELVQKGRRR